ncbi:MAG TPA: glycosyltransferase family 39 protein [Terriglobales bacterium]|nr:glycosyltransferase family 39 protein [Terriglobales bacterium]
MTAGHTYRFSGSEGNFGFGWESGRIAASLVAGNGFSSPFARPTGPSAWVAPLYPAIIAGVFRVFGVYTFASAWTLLALNSVFSALTCLALWGIGEMAFDRRLAVWSAWTWALLPYSIYWAVRWVWETSLSALLLSVAVLLALRLARASRMRDWAFTGLVWGAIALANPSMLSVMPFALAWPAWRVISAARHNFARTLRGPALAAGIGLACITPWLIRDYRVFGTFIFIRSNLGAELRMGNSEAAEGLWMWWVHPSQNAVELDRVARMGEVNYARARKQEALRFIAAHPGRFARLCARRFAFYWAGTPRNYEYSFGSRARTALFVLSSALAGWGLVLAIRNRRRGAWLFAAVMLVYPAVYYITFPHPRYRHPIEPLMTVLGLYVLSLAVPRRLTQGAAPEPEPLTALPEAA